MTVHTVVIIYLIVQYYQSGAVYYCFTQTLHHAFQENHNLNDMYVLFTLRKGGSWFFNLRKIYKKQKMTSKSLSLLSSASLKFNYVNNKKKNCACAYYIVLIRKTRVIQY